MNGLLEKDILILIKQKKLFVIYLASAIMLSFAMDDSFVVSYFTMIGGLLALATISYDSFDNGLPFLMSLPVNAKTYAAEKYAISLIGMLFSWTAGVLAQFASMLLQQRSIDVADVLGMDFAYIPVFLIIISICLPVNLKFGSEKGRIILVALIAIGMATGLLGKNILSGLLSDSDMLKLENLVARLTAFPQGAIVSAAFVLGIVVFLASMMISVGIMGKKEF